MIKKYTIHSIVFFSLCLLSCSNTLVNQKITPLPPLKSSTNILPVNTHSIITNSNLTDGLKFWNIKPKTLEMADAAYTVIPKSQVESYIKGYILFANLNGLYYSKPHKNDCDDFSRAFSFYCRAAANRNTNFTYSIAVADIYFFNTNTSHAINLIITINSNRMYEPVFIDVGKAISSPTNRFVFPTNWHKDIYFLNM